MTTSISLALAAKLNLILCPPDSDNKSKFVSFVPPLTKLQFKYSELEFFDGDSAGIDANTLEMNRSNFAMIVNQIPPDNIVFNPLDKGVLWDVFENNVINNSVTAKVSLSEEEKTKLVQAHAYCNENFALYKSYKNAFDQCQLDYKEAKCSLEFATGEEKEKLQKEWSDYKEKSLLDKIDAAKNDLLILGKQNEVVAALDTINNVEAKKGVTTLRDDIRIKLDGLFSKGVPNRAGTEYVYTDFSPLGSFDENSPAWNQIVLYSSEIARLCADAPEPLKKLFVDETPTPGIESISFEYALISVVREWFSESLLSSSNWKFAIDSEPVSNGKIPAEGLIPAYINKILCVRKISYKQKKTTPVQDKMKIGILSNVAVKDISIKKTVAVQPNRFVQKKSWANPLAGRVFMRAPVKPAPAKTTTPDPKNFIKDRQLWRKNNIATFFNRIPQKPQPAATDLPVTVHSLDGIVFIAFECKRVGPSPHPDQSLAWE